MEMHKAGEKCLVKTKVKDYIKALLLWLFCFSFLSFARKSEEVTLRNQWTLQVCYSSLQKTLSYIIFLPPFCIGWYFNSTFLSFWPSLVAFFSKS